MKELFTKEEIISATKESLQEMHRKLNTKQKLCDLFNQAYWNACKQSSNYMEPALLARQLINQLVFEGILTDNFNEVMAKSSDKEEEKVVEKEETNKGFKCDKCRDSGYEYLTPYDFERCSCNK